MGLEVSSLRMSFGERLLWDDVNLRAEPGTMTALVGASGSGKSTLLNCIGMLTEPDHGSVHFDGRSLLNLTYGQRQRFRRDVLGYLFQNYALIEDASVKENLSVAMRGRGRTDTQAMESALDTVGLSGRLQAKVATLSGGEQQRVALARLLVKSAKLILADEPTGALDLANAHGVLRQLRGMAEQGATIVIATHDPEVREACDQVLDLSMTKTSVQGIA